MNAAFVVTYEHRDVLGRIVTEVDSIYVSEANAEARASVINSDPGLFPGMVADVEDYPVADGRLYQPARSQLSGAMRSTIKLNPKAASEIRARAAQGEAQAAIAEDYGVSPGTIGDIVRGRTWRTNE